MPLIVKRHFIIKLIQNQIQRTEDKRHCVNRKSWQVAWRLISLWQFCFEERGGIGGNSEQLRSQGLSPLPLLSLRRQGRESRGPGDEVDVISCYFSFVRPITWPHQFIDGDHVTIIAVITTCTAKLYWDNNPKNIKKAKRIHKKITSLKVEK